MSAGRERARPVCRLCAHFRITHLAETPYGCAAFGLRSRLLPSVEVERASGEPCRAFAPRAAAAPPAAGAADADEAPGE